MAQYGFITTTAAVTFLSVLMTGGANPAASAPSTVVSAYSLAAPLSTSASGIVARAVVPAGVTCPTLQISLTQGTKRAISMTERPRPANTGSAFAPLSVCSAAVPVGAQSATIAGISIPHVMPSRVARLALVADSGCAINPAEVQDCSDPDSWPLAKVSAAIAAERPDAIVINGDFFYREAPCPLGQENFCGSSPAPIPGMPFSDSAYGWMADVFIPMSPMLNAAPLIVTRGNHEECSRAGNGYFYFFDPRHDSSNTCAPTVDNGQVIAATNVPTATYAIDLAVSPGRTLRLAVVDSSGGNDAEVSPYSIIQRPSYQHAAALTKRQAGRESWLLTHRPIFGFASSVFATPSTPIAWGSADQAAAAWELLDTYNLIFSSHMHIAQVVQLPDLPAQLILGNAGTDLEPATGYVLPDAGFNIGAGRTYPAPSSAWVDVRFGYAIAVPEKSAGVWRIRMADVNGATFATCGLRNTQMYCR